MATASLNRANTALILLMVVVSVFCGSMALVVVTYWGFPNGGFGIALCLAAWGVCIRMLQATLNGAPA